MFIIFTSLSYLVWLLRDICMAKQSGKLLGSYMWQIGTKRSNTCSTDASGQQIQPD